MKKLLLIFLCTLWCTSFSFSQAKKMHFAIGFFTSGHSQMITYAFLTESNGKIIGAEIVRKDRFIYTALGYWPSNINPERKDYFMEHQVDSVFLIKSGSKVVGYYAKPFEGLWKIRFKEHPYSYDEYGWSQGQYKPSPPQEEILRKDYGINNILTDYIYGDSLFKLLRDVQSPGWVSLYRAGVSADTTQTDTTSTP